MGPGRYSSKLIIIGSFKDLGLVGGFGEKIKGELREGWLKEKEEPGSRFYKRGFFYKEKGEFRKGEKRRKKNCFG